MRYESSCFVIFPSFPYKAIHIFIRKLQAVTLSFCYCLHKQSVNGFHFLYPRFASKGFDSSRIFQQCVRIFFET